MAVDTHSSMNEYFDAEIGLGEGGSRIAQSVCDVLNNSLVIMNFNKADAKSINVPESNKIVYDLEGTGRDPEIGASHYLKMKDDIERQLTACIDKLGIESVLLCVGGGGGSGTATLFPVLDFFRSKDIMCSVIYTLPKDDEGFASVRAIKILNRLIKDYIKTGEIRAAFLIDNEFCYKKYGAGTGIWDHINQNIADSLGGMLKIPVDPQADWTTSGYKVFDVSDLKSMMFMGRGFSDVILAKADKKLVNELVTKPEAVNKLELKSSLFPRYAYETSVKGYIASLSLAEDLKKDKATMQVCDQIFAYVADKFQCPNCIKSIAYHPLTQGIELRILASGLTLSDDFQAYIESKAREMKTFKGKDELDELDTSALDDI